MPYDLPPSPPIPPSLTASPRFEVVQLSGQPALTDRTFLGGKIIIGDIESIDCPGDKAQCQGQPHYWVKAEILDPSLFSDWSIFGSEFYKRNGIEVSRYLLQAIAIELGIKPQDIRLDLYLDCQSITLQEQEVKFDYCRGGLRWLAKSPKRSPTRISSNHLDRARY